MKSEYNTEDKTKRQVENNTIGRGENDSTRILFSLDPILSLTAEELDAAAVLARPWDQEDARLLAREFRETQPGICAWIPYTASTPRTEASENGITCAIVRRLCIALKARFDWVPVLDEALIRTAERIARSMLAEPSIREPLEQAPVVKFARRQPADPTRRTEAHSYLNSEKYVFRLLVLLISFATAYAVAEFHNSKHDSPPDNPPSTPVESGGPQTD